MIPSFLRENQMYRRHGMLQLYGYRMRPRVYEVANIIETVLDEIDTAPAAAAAGAFLLFLAGGSAAAAAAFLLFFAIVPRVGGTC